MTALEIILFLLCLILLSVLIFRSKEIKSLAKKVHDIRDKDTNETIHSFGSSKYTDELINEINALLKEVRSEHILYNRKNHSLDQMITNISHDLRTPLTSAMGYINIIRNSELSEEEKNREIEIVEKRLMRLEELLNSFFEFSQIISCGQTPKTESLNIVAVLEESIAHSYDDYCEQNREIIFDCQKAKITVNSNKNMLIRIFDNLIGNALKHGKDTLKVTVRIFDDIQISFENSLISNAIDIDHVFDEFYTTDISRTKGNTGLGLAIAKEFTEMLGGEISAKTQGNLFIIKICLKQ